MIHWFWLIVAFVAVPKDTIFFINPDKTDTAIIARDKDTSFVYRPYHQYKIALAEGNKNESVGHWLIPFLVGFVAGGLFMTVVVSCLSAHRITWWRGRAEHLEKIICVLAKRFPCKDWDTFDSDGGKYAYTPAVQSECMDIIERSYREVL